MISKFFNRSLRTAGTFSFQKRTFIRTYQYQRQKAEDPCYFTEVSYLEACHLHHQEAVKIESTSRPESSSDDESLNEFSHQFEGSVPETSGYQHYKPPRRMRSRN